MGAPFDFLFLFFDFGFFFVSTPEFEFVEVGAEDSEGVLPVVELGAGFGVFYGDSCGDVPYADSGFYFVDVLTAGAAGAEGVPF